MTIDSIEVQKWLSPEAQVFSPGDEGYETSIARWSKASEKQAGLVIVPATVADVQVAVKWGAQYDLAIKGGGHSPNGASSTEGGVVVDLGNLQAFTVDVEKKTIRVQGGATWAVVDKALAQHGLATVGGTVSHTGIGGLTLGGGYGLLQGKHGLVVDNLLEVKMVTVKGELVTANKEENTDLFWALRGAGCNMGVSVEFLYQAHPQGDVLGGGYFFPIEKFKAVVDFCLKIEVSGGKAAGGAVILAPPPAFQPCCMAMVFYDGPEEEARAFFKPLVDLDPIADHTTYQPYHVVNAGSDSFMPHGLRRVMKSTPIQLPLSQETCDGIIERYTDLLKTYPSTKDGVSAILIEVADQSKIASVPADTTAVSSRRKTQVFGCILGYEDPIIDKEVRKWSQDVSNYISSHYSKDIKAAPPNFSLGSESPHDTYGTNFQRLKEIKAIWDPENVFNKWHPVTPN